MDLRPASVERARSRERGEEGFTLVELMVSLTVLAVAVFATMQVFLTSLATATSAEARTRASGLATREVESMRAAAYDRVGFSATATGFRATVTEGGVVYETVVVADPAFAPLDADVVTEGVVFSIRRDIVWQASGSAAHAYKRLIATITWVDDDGSHEVRQDAGLYPGGLGVYTGATTTSTIVSIAPGAPVGLAAAPDSSDPYTRINLTWVAGTPSPQTWTVQYSINSGASWVTVTTTEPGGSAGYSAEGLSSGTLYRFRVRGVTGTQHSSWAEATATTAIPPAGCQFGSVSVTPAEVRKNSGNNRLRDDLRVLVNTNGECSGLKVQYPAEGSPAARTMVDGGSTFTDTLNKNAYTWSTGDKVIRILSSTGTQLASISLRVTN